MLEEYKKHISKIERQSDFFEFWDDKLNELKNKELKVVFTEELQKEDVLRKSFLYNTIDDKMISGNIFLPNNKRDDLPVIVTYHGLGANTFGDDYFSVIYSTWLKNGFIVVGFDVRGQNGKSEYDEKEPFFEYGLYCRNILDKNNYYYVKTYLDAIRLLDVVQSFEETKNKKIVCNGGSQGGAITLAVCSLDERPILAFADIPSNSDIKNMVKESSGGFRSINHLISDTHNTVEQIFSTLSYVDICNLASTINIPILCSVGSLDHICPPIGFYQAYRQIKSEKYLEIYENFGHGGYDSINFSKKMDLLEKKLNLKV